MLVNAVPSGSLPLVEYLWSINDIDIKDGSNTSIKLVYQAICTWWAVYTVLGHEKIYSVTVYHINYDEDYSTTVPDCINAAYLWKGKSGKNNFVMLA